MQGEERGKCASFPRGVVLVLGSEKTNNARYYSCSQGVTVWRQNTFFESMKNIITEVTSLPLQTWWRRKVGECGQPPMALQRRPDLRGAGRTNLQWRKP